MHVMCTFLRSAQECSLVPQTTCAESGNTEYCINLYVACCDASRVGWLPLPQRFTCTHECAPPTQKGEMHCVCEERTCCRGMTVWIAAPLPGSGSLLLRVLDWFKHLRSFSDYKLSRLRRLYSSTLVVYVWTLRRLRSVVGRPTVHACSGRHTLVSVMTTT
jgi:hypothetical protein